MPTESYIPIPNTGIFKGGTCTSTSGGCCCPNNTGSPGKTTHAPAQNKIWAGRGTQGASGDANSAGGSGDWTDWPIRYGDGEIKLDVADLTSDGFGLGWGHTRSYSNTLGDLAPGQNGFYWFIKEQPIALNMAGSFGSEHPATIAIIGTASGAKWFDWDGANYVPRFDVKDSLASDLDGNLVQKDSSGQTTIFKKMDDATRPGTFESFTDRNGHTWLADYDGSRLNYIEISIGGQKQRFQYTYYAAGGPHAGLLQTVTWQTQRGSAPVQDVRRVEYTYHTDGLKGSLNDLKTATVQVPDGSTGWSTVANSYYRYYTGSETAGFQHALKFVVGPEACDRIGGDPDALDDSALAVYADNYYEYDGSHAVVTEKVRGVTLPYTYDRGTISAFEDGHNNWKTCTTETLPDGCHRTAYSNFAGQVMLKVLTAGTEEWYEYTRYDDKGRVILQANSSAVQSYTADDPGLVTLKADGDFIRTYAYYADDATEEGQAPGYLAAEYVQRGSNGTAIILQNWAYTRQQASDGRVGYVVYENDVYRCTTGQDPAATNYLYEWYDGTMQAKNRETTLPLVPETEHGSNHNGRPTRHDWFDEFGQLQWTMNERGCITGFQIDPLTGAVTRRVDDAGPLENPPWPPSLGGHLNLVTEYENDSLGRMVQELGPEHTVDLGGTPTAIRRARWIVYKEDLRQQWEAVGYATRSASSSSSSSGDQLPSPASEWDTFTLINPVSITQYDIAGRVLEQIQAVRASTTGKLSPDDAFTQADYRRWTTNYYGSDGNLLWQRVYHQIPLAALADGSESENPGDYYAQTSYVYDNAGRLVKTTSPEGTITVRLFDAAGRLSAVQVGTTDSNMRPVEEYEYDEGEDKQDDNVTRITRQVSDAAAEARVTHYLYDWRNRVWRMVAEEGTAQTYDYCNLDRRFKTTAWATTDSPALPIPCSSSSSSSSTTPDMALWTRKELLDHRGRVYASILYPGDDGTTPFLVDDFWYDTAGNLIKQRKAGSRAFQKTAYDTLNRPVARYVCYDLGEDDTDYEAAQSVASNIVVQQEKMEYDAGGTMIKHATYERFHDAPVTGSEALGELVGPNETA